MAYTNTVAHNLAAIRAARRESTAVRAAKNAEFAHQSENLLTDAELDRMMRTTAKSAAEKREPDGADRVAERVRSMPPPKRQQEDW